MQDPRDSQYFKTEIKDKVYQYLGMIGLDLYPPTCFKTKQEQNQLDYFDQQIEYFIVDSKQQIGNTLQNEINEALQLITEQKQKTDHPLLDQRSNNQKILLILKINSKQATVQVYSFQLQGRSTKRLYEWRNMLNQEQLIVVQQILKYSTLIEFTGILFSSIIINQYYISYNFKIGVHSFNVKNNISFKSEVNKIEDQIMSFIITFLHQQIVEQPLNYQYIHKFAISQKLKPPEQLLGQIPWIKRTILLYNCKQLGILLNKSEISQYKDKLYVLKICDLVRNYLQESINLSSQITQMIIKIVQQSNNQTVIALFEKICKLFPQFSTSVK